ncbi:MAG: PEGA domain-containing protein [Methanomicrobiaceae archaeon]|nr:PEGA domain-containing protein [Methanomicrobiaceae archaeon]
MISPTYAGNTADFTLQYGPASIHQGDDLTLFGTAPVTDGGILDFRFYNNDDKIPVYYAAKEVYSGNFKFSIDTEDIKYGNYTIQMYYEGSIKASADILLLQENEITVNILPKNGALRIYSTPGGASVYIDGNFIGLTEIHKGIQINGIEPGEHTVNLTKTGYRNQSQIATVYADMLNEINFYLAKMPTNGTLSICSYPSEADIYLGDKLIGVTDDIFPDMAPGNYQLQLWKKISGSDSNSSSFSDKLYNYEGEIEIKAGEITSVFAYLEEMKQPSVLEVKTIPNFAEVHIDGMYVGESNIVLNPIAEGYHTISLFKPGYVEYTGTINIPEEGMSFKMTLSPIYETGKLLIAKSNPSELPIYVDEQFRGRTPESITGLEVGAHEVSVKNGDSEWKTTIEITYSGSTTVFADFSKETMTEAEATINNEMQNNTGENEDFSEEELKKMYGVGLYNEQTDHIKEEPESEESGNKTIIDDIIGMISGILPI